MLPVSSNYATIISNDAHYAEVKIIVGEVGDVRVTYGMDKIMSLSTHCSLYGDYIDIGKCVINEFEAVLTGVSPAQIPKMSRVEVWVRLRVGNTGTNWLPKGVFYTRKPERDEITGYLSISGLDSMYRGEALPYPLGSTVSGWNTETTRTVAGRMATFMGVALEDATQIPEFAFALPPFGYTAREILHDIGTACCGNFTFTYVNNGTQAAPQMTPLLRFVPIDHRSTTVQLGKNVQSFSHGDQIPLVSYVCVNYGYDQEGATLSKFAGTEGGTRDVEFTISTITDGDVIQAIATHLYDTLSPLTYVPWTATGIPLDPAVEIGDTASCNNYMGVMGSIDTAFSKAMYASVIAPPIPEEEDFPMYSADREIQRNYETEASRIAGTVKFVDLSTSGATEINGANIKTGTITLGGSEAGSPEMVLLDENDNVIGRWDKDRITIHDDTATDQLLKNAKFAVIRKGASDNTEFGAFIGSTQVWNAFFPDQYPDESVPFLYLQGTRDGTNPSGFTSIFGGNINIDGTIITGSPQDATGLTFTKTDNSSTANLSSYTVKKWGRMVQVTLHLTNVNYAGAGGVIWKGEITGTTLADITPIDTVTGVGVNGANQCFGQLSVGTNKLDLAIYASASGYQSNWTANLSFTFLV